MKKFMWKYIYRFNRRFLGWIPTVTIASSKLYEEKDEYVTLRADGWVTVRSKKNPKSIDMLPINLVSEKCHYLFAESLGIDITSED